MTRPEIVAVLTRHGLPPIHAGAADVAARLVELETELERSRQRVEQLEPESYEGYTWLYANEAGEEAEWEAEKGLESPWLCFAGVMFYPVRDAEGRHIHRKSEP